MVGRARLLAGALVAASLAAEAPTAAATDAPLCRVSVHLDPERAVPGQQVLYRLQIDQRDDVEQLRWEEHLSFPAFRAEWLPARQLGASSAPDGEGRRLVEERRALFPAAAGTLRIPAASFRCESATRSEAVVVAPTSLDVQPIPEGGPIGLALVGPVSLRVEAGRERLRLGESVRISASLSGTGNLWDARDPLGALAGLEADLFPEDNRVARDVAFQLKLRRTFAVTVVPRRSGALEVPALVVPYLDPDTGAWTEARSEPISVWVEDALRGDREGPSPPSTAERAPDPPAATPPSRRWRAPAAIAAALALGLALGVAWQRRRANARAEDDTPARIARALAAAEHSGDPVAGAAELARALRLALGRHIPGAEALSAEELEPLAAGRSGLAEPAQLLRRCEQLRFARDASQTELRVLLRSVRAALDGGASPPRDGSDGAGR